MKCTKSKNRMQITIGNSLQDSVNILGQSERNTGNVGEVFVSKVFYEHQLFTSLKKSSKSSTIPVCLSESCLSHDVICVLHYLKVYHLGFYSTFKVN